MSRRRFLWIAGASAVGAPEVAAIRALGTIRFCRISDSSLREAAMAIGGRDVVVEVDPAVSGMTFLGSRATLVVDRDDWRLFAPSAL